MKIFTNVGAAVSFQVKSSIRQRGSKCGGGGDMGIDAGDVHNRHAVFAVDLQCWSCGVSLHPQRLFHHEPLKAEQKLTTGTPLTRWPPVVPFLQPPLLKKLSLYYPCLFLPLWLSGGGASNPAIQVLVSAAPFSSAVTLSLSPRCPSATSTTHLFVSIIPKWAKMAHSESWNSGVHVKV